MSYKYLFLTIVFLFIGCKTEPNSSLDPSLVSGQWQIHYQSQAYALPKGDLSTILSSLVFFNDGFVSVNTQCGTYSYGFTLAAGNHIQFEDQFENEPNCNSPLVIEQVNTQLDFLLAVNSFEVDDDQLILSSSDSNSFQMVAERPFNGCDQPNSFIDPNPNETYHLQFSTEKFDGYELVKLQRQRPDIEILEGDYCVGEIMIKANAETLKRLTCDSRILSIAPVAQVANRASAIQSKGC